MNQVREVFLALVLSAFILMSAVFASTMIVLSVRWVMTNPQVGVPIAVGLWMGLSWYLHHIGTEN